MPAPHPTPRSLSGREPARRASARLTVLVGILALTASMFGLAGAPAAAAPPGAPVTSALLAPLPVQVPGSFPTPSALAQRISPVQHRSLRLTAPTKKGGRATLSSKRHPDRQRWDLTIGGAGLRVVDSTTGRCLTAASKGRVTVGSCGQTKTSTLWRFVPRSGGSYDLASVKTGRLLTNRSRNRLTLAKRSASGKGQRWLSPDFPPKPSATAQSCASPTAEVGVPVLPGSTTSGRAGRAATRKAAHDALTKAQADAASAPGTAASTALSLLTFLGETALGFGEDEALGELGGWLLNSLGFGTETKGLDPAEIDAQFAGVNTQLSAIQTQQYNDCLAILGAVSEAEQVLVKQDDVTTYSILAGQMAEPLGKIAAAQSAFNSVVTELQANGGDVSALNSDRLNALASMRDDADGLPAAVAKINEHLAVEQPNANSMISQLSQVEVDIDRQRLGQDYNPFKSHLYPASLVRVAAAQQRYYAAVVTQANLLYANAAHLTFTAKATNYTPDGIGVQTLVNNSRNYIQQWQSVFADGPLGLRTSEDWVSQDKGQGIADIPEGTVLDYRVQNHPRLWTASGVALGGDDPNQTHAYCPGTAQFCYADRYDATQRVADTALVPPSPRPLTAMIAAEHAQPGDGWWSEDGWRIPLQDDWSSLQASATGGLGTWGPANDLTVFSPETITSHAGGKDVKISTITPVLVDDQDGSYGILSSADASANTLMREQDPFTPDAQSGLAARAVLVRDFQPSTKPDPITGNPPAASGARVDEHGAAAPTAPAKPTATAKPAAPAESSKQVGRARRAAVPGPVSFTTPTSCATAPATYTVPAGVGAVTVTATGGAGAAGTQSNSISNSGGRGGSTTETIPVSAGNVLYVQVGGAGRTGSGVNGDYSRQLGGAGGVGGGGAGGNTVPPHSDEKYGDPGGHSGGGGGASGVSSTSSCAQWLVLGGGGGGGGSSYVNTDTIVVDDLNAGGDGSRACAPSAGSCAKGADGNQASGTSGKGGSTVPANDGGAGTAGGTSGTTLTGGQGGSGAVNATSITGAVTSGGGGGGGGGAGYFGGGGGGGAGVKSGGGGGAGGSSFGIAGGLGSPTFDLGSYRAAGSVTITPVTTAAPTFELEAQPGTISWTDPVTLTATLPDRATGTVTFSDSASGELGVAPVRRGVASLTVDRALAIGSHTMKAAYVGDSHFRPVSGTAALSVDKKFPALRLVVTGTAPAAGQLPRSFVAQLPEDATGGVGFYNDVNRGCEGSKEPGAACVGLGTAPIVKGFASRTTTTRPLLASPAGTTNLVHVSYDGDAHYAAVDSDPVKVTLKSLG